MQTTPRGRQRRESSPPESLCETPRMKQDSKSPCSSKAVASRENHAGNWIQSGTVTASI